MNSIPSAIFGHLLETVRSDYEEQEKLSEGTLSMLLSLFDSIAIEALDLVDHKCISLITSPSGRELYKVERSASEFYICLKNSNYCSCPAFTFQVLKKGLMMCKHKLAASLCSAMGLCNKVQYADETVVLMLLGENNT
ncbi:hypothetical protein JTE90_015361 [Oedothorax gibbosus]|uniref:SWIM-type domain-containing protein n=1 Tax=Oedothorax gibbosus TaxID=931172 RepID=A0AAV6U4Q9_9ARAC|nr:hypothetical protein JTE90_015361 [Oedothorax gibbosus]